MNDIPVLYKEKEDCCGCKACANVCPEGAILFLDDEYGFSYSHIDAKKCIGCKRCVKTCDFQKSIGVAQNYPIKSYAAVNKDNHILKKSSSGGAFTALANVILEKNGVVFGCILNDENNPVHICIDNKSDLAIMRGSKYVQSDVGFTYQEVKRRLETSQFVLFSGTPCQVAALQSFLGNKTYDNLLTVDLVCHGVPSVLMFQQYLARLEQKYQGRVVNYRFRSKVHGWGNFVQEVDIDLGNKIKKKYIGSNSEFYLPNFRKGNLNRPSCYRCKYACAKRVGDFTIGDFWGYQNAGLKIKSEKGISALLINNEKANCYLPKLTQYIDIEPVETEIIIRGNGQLRMPMKRGCDWDYYMNALCEGQIKNVADQYIKQNKKSILKQKVIDFLPHSIIGILRDIKHLGKGLRNK